MINEPSAYVKYEDDGNNVEHEQLFNVDGLTFDKKAVFGDDIAIYGIKQSVASKTTLHFHVISMMCLKTIVKINKITMTKN